MRPIWTLAGACALQSWHQSRAASLAGCRSRIAAGLRGDSACGAHEQTRGLLLQWKQSPRERLGYEYLHSGQQRELEGGQVLAGQLSQIQVPPLDADGTLELEGIESVPCSPVPRYGYGGRSHGEGTCVTAGRAGRRRVSVSVP